MRTLAVRFAAMTNGNDINESFPIDDSIHNAPLADSDAPQIACSFELFRPSGARAARERFYAFEDAQRNRGIKRLKLFARRSRKDDSEFSHALCA